MCIRYILNYRAHKLHIYDVAYMYIDTYGTTIDGMWLTVSLHVGYVVICYSDSV